MSPHHPHHAVPHRPATGRRPASKAPVPDRHAGGRAPARPGGPDPRGPRSRRRTALGTSARGTSARGTSARGTSAPRLAVPGLSVLTLALITGLLAPLSAAAQAPQGRTALGRSLTIPAGQVVRDATAFDGDLRVDGEVRGDATAFGGDLLVDGEVHGDASAFGGDVVVRPPGRVHGELVSFGGNVEERAVSGGAADRVGPSAAPAAAGPLETAWGWLQETARSAIAHVLLFLLGLLLLGTGRERLGALQVTMVRDGVKTAGIGLLAYVAAGLALVLLCVTLVGIPLAVVGLLALPVATYLGLAAAATVLGAALPIPQLKDQEVAQLGAGVLVLFVCSLVPVVGGLATAVAACLGFGALVRTRFSPTPPSDLPPGGGSGAPRVAAAR